MITLRGAVKVMKSKGSAVVLAGVDARFPRGLSTGILGPKPAVNGALMKLFSGADVLDEGTIRVDAAVSWPLGYGAAVGGNMSARDASMFVARLYGENPRRVVRFVSDFADVGGAFERNLKEASAEVRNRVHMALAFSIDFECYLVEGAGGKGGAEFRRKCWDMLRQKQAAGADLIVATQLPKLVRETCDAAAVLDNGALTFYDEIDEAVDAFRHLAGAQPRKKGNRMSTEGISP